MLANAIPLNSNLPKIATENSYRLPKIATENSYRLPKIAGTYSNLDPNRSNPTWEPNIQLTDKKYIMYNKIIYRINHKPSVCV